MRLAQLQRPCQHGLGPSLSGDDVSPRVSLVLLAYRQEATVAAAARAALAQSGDPIEIVLSDDRSPDATFGAMRAAAAAYAGPHSVVLRQSAANMGLVRHLEEAVRLAQGELIVIAAGDDVSLPDRARRLTAAWLSSGGMPAYLYSDVRPIGTDGSPISWPAGERIYAGEHSLAGMAGGAIATLGASAAFTRDLVTYFKPIRASARHEDRVLPFRAALLGGRVIYVDEPLVEYRLEGGVSRNLPVSKADYLRRWTQEINIRTIEDAIQRLDDAQAMGAPSAVLRACRRTIDHQRAMIDLARSSGLGIERAAVRGVMRGAKARPLMAHYLKMRLPVGRRNF